MEKSSRRTRRKPPPRLSWPVSLVTRSNDAEKNGRKRSRTTEQTNLWVDKFAPSASVDLCVAPKKIKECQAWIEDATSWNSSTPRKKLLVLVGTPGCGKSTMVRVLAKELGLDVHSWNESFVARTRGDSNFDPVISVEHSSALDSFEEFLVQCGAGFSALQFTTQKGSLNKRSLILLEDLPNLHGTEAEQRFRRIVTDHLRGSHVPTIMIYSDVSEGKHRPADLERLVDPKDLYSSSSLICQIHPVTKPKMKKIIEKIAKQQSCRVSSTFFEDLYSHSDGDIRHAIMTLQLQSTGIKSLSPSSDHSDRDHKLSTFHALGKLLYAKRTLDAGGTSRLAFDPEEILAQSDLGVAGSLRFLEYHSTEFFTDIEDLANAFSFFSDAGMLMDNPEHVRRPLLEWRDVIYTCPGFLIDLFPCAAFLTNSHTSGIRIFRKVVLHQ